MGKIHEIHKEVMHYTSGSGLEGIVTSKTLWATHASFLNDSEEVTGFFDRVLHKILRDPWHRYISDKHRGAVMDMVGEETLFKEKLLGICGAFRDAQLLASDHYVSSFCTSDDPWVQGNGLLSQWRGYGHDGGYAIVFHTQGLDRLLERESKIYDEEAILWADAQYRMDDDPQVVTDEEIQTRIRRFQDAAYRAFCNGMRIENSAWDDLMILSTTRKHRGFEEEKEVRVIVTEPTPAVGQDLAQGKRRYRQTKQFIRNGAPVPCIHLFEDQDLTTLPITRVIIGPHPSKMERRKAVELLLASNQIKAQVVVSDTPYRGP